MIVKTVVALSIIFSPHGGTLAATEAFVRRHFKLLIGKIYRGSDTDTTLWLALDRKIDHTALLQEIRADAAVSPPITL